MIFKNTLDEINSRSESSEENISNLDDIAMETIQNETEGKNNWKKWTEHQWSLGQLQVASSMYD